jgi:phage virion morphogenesis protein
MAGVSVELDMTGIDRLSSMISALSENMENLQAALLDIGEHIVSQAKMNFRSETGPDGVPWKESARAREEEGQTMTLTARLKNSITAQVTGDSVTVGTNVIYAAAHQMGFIGNVVVPAHERRITQAFGRRLKEEKRISVRSHAAKRTLVPRPYLPRSVEEAGVTEIEEIIMNHLMAGRDHA